MHPSRFLNTAARRRALLAALLGAAAGGGACAGGAPAPPRDEPVRTSASRYRLRTTREFYEVAIPAVYTNRTADTVYLEPCNEGPPFALEKRDGARWRPALAPVCVAILAPPVVVPPGGAYADTVRILAARRQDAAPAFAVGRVPGVYRLTYAGYRTWHAGTGRPGLGEELPRGALASNEFRLDE